MSLAPPITDIQQPAVGIYGLPIGASAGPMVQLTAAQIRAIAEVSTPDLSGYAQLSGATFTGNVLLQNSTTAVILTLEKTYTSATNREYLYEGYDATAGYAGYHVSSRVGSAGGSNRALYLGHVSSGGTFAGVIVATTGDTTVTHSITSTNGQAYFGVFAGSVSTPRIDFYGTAGATHNLYFYQNTTAKNWLRANSTAIGLYASGGNSIAVSDTAVTATGKLATSASTTSAASFCIPSGTAPTSPVNGDIWSDGSDIKVRLGGVTYTLTKA